MTRPTRQEQAQAILHLRGWQLASSILGRRATNAGDFDEAFNLERIDLVSEMPNPAAMMEFGRNVVGPRDGLYILDDGETYRVYIQERGEAYFETLGVDFDAARNAVIDRLLQLGGIPYLPEG